MDDMALKALIEGKPEHWTDNALCVGDARFTGRYSDLTYADKGQMISLCSRCPVYEQCGNWAVSEQVTGVWATGYWRGPIGDGDGLS